MHIHALRFVYELSGRWLLSMDAFLVGFVPEQVEQLFTVGQFWVNRG